MIDASPYMYSSPFAPFTFHKQEDEELRPSTAVDLTTGVSLSWIIGQQEEATGSFKISRKRVMADQPELPTRKDPVCGKRSKQKHYLC